MIPRKDALLLPYSNNWNARLQASWADFRLTEADAERYSDLHSAFASAYNTMMAARAEGTRSESQTATVHAAKTALLTYARELYARVKANSSVSEANKTLLGIHVAAGGPSRIEPPTERPSVMVGAVTGQTIELMIGNGAASGRSRKPDGCVQAIVMYCTAEQFASDPHEWRFAGLATRDKFSFTVPHTIAGGTRVWVRAAWTNRAGEAGPDSVAVATNVQGGGVNIPALRAA